MKGNKLFGRMAAVFAALALTVCGACLVSVRTEREALRTGSSAGARQVIILDAGHGEST